MRLECFGWEHAAPFDRLPSAFSCVFVAVKLALSNVAVSAVLSIRPPAVPVTFTNVPPARFCARVEDRDLDPFDHDVVVADTMLWAWPWQRFGGDRFDRALCGVRGAVVEGQFSDLPFPGP